MTDKIVSLGYSTCPNDTYIFYALAHGLVSCPCRFQITLADVESLNQAAKNASLQATKLSFAALGHLQENYGLLRTGAALGRGCGPLIIARPGRDLAGLKKARIAVPGMWTTACLLLGLYLDGRFEPVPMSFEAIMPAVSSGKFDYGVIIHEGRFTYPQFGLNCLLDLGQWWEDETGKPIPLGCIAMRRDVPRQTGRMIEKAILDSILYADDHPGASDAYIQKHAQEMAPQVIRQHINLYVNAFSRNLGQEGETAVETLFAMARQKGMMPESRMPVFF